MSHTRGVSGDTDSGGKTPVQAQVAKPESAPEDSSLGKEAPAAEASEEEASKGEAPKAEASKGEAPKAEAPKEEAPKGEAPKAEAPKEEAPQAEAPKGEQPTSCPPLDLSRTGILPPFDPAASTPGEGTQVLPPFSMSEEIVSCEELQLPEHLKAVVSPRTTPGGTPLTKRFLQVGTRFISYRIKGELARGGMGVVYRAEHIGLQRQVALKIIARGALATADSRRRFLREARAAASLDHPYIVGVLEAGRHDGIDFMAMPLVEGRSLTAIWGSANVKRAERLALFCHVCEGIEHAHTRGVIHRDLKPDNVLVTPDGTPRILDFGVAKKLDDEAFATADGSLIGTILYMAPEATTSKRPTDVRCDVYSLGAVLYEGLAGRPPFQGTVQEILHDLHYGNISPPSAYADVGSELDAVCLRAVARDPEDRYQSVLELRRDIERYIAGEPVRALPGSRVYRLFKLARRRPLETGVLVAALILGLFAGGLSWRSIKESERKAAASTSAAVAEAWSQLREGKFAESAATFAQAEALLGDQRVLRIEGDLVQLVEEDKGPLITVDRLRRWRELAGQRGRRARAELGLAKARTSLAANELEDAVRQVEAAGLLGHGESWSALRDEIAAATVREAMLLFESGDQAAVRRSKALCEATLRISAEHALARETHGKALVELAAADERARQRALATERSKRALALAAQGQEALEAGDYRRASSQFLASLELHVSEDARRGLVATERKRADAARVDAADADAAVAERAEERALKQALERLGKLLAASDRALSEARARFVKRALPEDVRERYWRALSDLRLAEAVAGADSARKAKVQASLKEVSREFAAVLERQRQRELAEFIRRIGGVSASESKAVELPRDPHLRVVEDSAVAARQAFGGSVVFEAGTGLDLIRGWLYQRLAGKRAHVEVRILSEMRRIGSETRVYLTGFKVRYADRARRTVSPPRHVLLESPRHRPAIIDALGRRRVRSFDRADGFRPRTLRALRDAIQKLLP